MSFGKPDDLLLSSSLSHTAHAAQKRKLTLLKVTPQTNTLAFEYEEPGPLLFL